MKLSFNNIKSIISSYSIIVLTAIFTLVIILILLFSYNNAKKEDLKFSIYSTELDAEKISNELNKNFKILQVLSENFSSEYIQKENNEFWKNSLLNENIEKIILVRPPEIKFYNDSLQTRKTDTVYYKSIIYSKNKGEINIEETNSNFDKIINPTLFYKIKKNKNIIVDEPKNQEIFGKDLEIIKIFFPVYSGDKFLGIIGIAFNPKKFEQIIYTNKNRLNTIKILLSEKNNIISFTGKDWNKTKNISEIEGTEKQLFEKINGKPANGTFGGYVYTTQIINPENSDNYWKIYNFTPLREFSKQILINTRYNIILIIIVYIFSILFINYLTKKFDEKFNETVERSINVASGKNTDFQNKSNVNEINIIDENLKKIYEKNLEYIKVSKKIIEGDYNSIEKNENVNDELSILVGQIIQKIKDIEIEKKENEKISEIEEWVRNGFAEIAKVQNLITSNLETLTLNLIKTLVNYTNAVFGGFYIHHYETDKRIELVSSYAFSSEKFIEKSFAVGEGLVGACVYAKKKIELSKLPENYMNISSGLGNALPGYLLITPVMWHNEVLGVIEIAFVNVPEKHKLQFIEQTAENISSSLNSSIVSIKTIELLAKSTNQTVELYNKEQELNEKIKELQSIQTEYDFHSKEMQSMLNAVNNTVMSIEYTPEGQLLTANDLYLQTMGFELKDLQGKTVFELVKAEQITELKEIIEEVKKGNLLRKQLVRYTKSGEPKNLSASYTPYKDSEGKVLRIIFFAFDVTEFIQK